MKPYFKICSTVDSYTLITNVHLYGSLYAAHFQYLTHKHLSLLLKNKEIESKDGRRCTMGKNQG